MKSKDLMNKKNFTVNEQHTTFVLNILCYIFFNIKNFSL